MCLSVGWYSAYHRLRSVAALRVKLALLFRLMSMGCPRIKALSALDFTRIDIPHLHRNLLTGHLAIHKVVLINEYYTAQLIRLIMAKCIARPLHEQMW